MNSNTPDHICREKHDCPYLGRDDWVDRVVQLDMHLKAIVLSFVPHVHMVWTNKTNYEKHHTCIVELTKAKNLYDSYIRHVLRNDLDYVFRFILVQNREKWWGKRKYIYKGKQYSTYTHYMDAYIFEHGSHRCRDAMFGIVYRKKHRRMYKNITWRI